MANEWHPTKNGLLTPDQVTSNSGKKVWWLLPYDDPNTGKHFDFEWEAIIKDRNRGYGCPFLANGNPRVWPGFNDLATTNPLLAKEWHPTKNGDCSPKNVTAGSNQSAWWKCIRGHEWKANINSRNRGRGCPVCKGESNTSFPEQAIFYYIKKFFLSSVNREKDLGFETDIYIPEYRIGIEYDGQYYHTNAEHDKLKDAKAINAGIKLIRIREPDCPPIESSSIIISRVDLTLKALEQAIIDTLNTLYRITGKTVDYDVDLQRDYIAIENLTEKTIKERSLAKMYPEIAAEWNYQKNGFLQPETVQFGSIKPIWWKCSKCGFEWRTTPNSRTNTKGEKGRNCPSCGKTKQIQSYYNTITAKRGSLLERNPELAKEWDYELNGDLLPQNVPPNSKKTVWWKCKKGHVWQACINLRNERGTNCPFCSNKRVLDGINDLATIDPELAKEWNYERNKGLINGNGVLIECPNQVTSGSAQKVWWRCEKGHEWQATVKMRHTRGDGCPICTREGKRNNNGF